MVASNVTDLVVNQYIRQPVPVNKDGMDTYLSGQLQEIENSMKTIGEGSIQVADAAPVRPLKGMVRYAVSPWNPLGDNFQGLVVYSGTTWLRASDPEGTVSDLADDVSANASAVSSLSSTVTSQGNTITAQGSSITTLNAGLTTANGNITANSSAISTLDSTVTTQGNTITAQASSITTLEAGLTDAESDISANASAVSSLTTTVTNQGNSITAQSQSITDLQSDLSDAESDITANASATTALTTRVTNAEGDITAISSSVTNLSTTVGDNTTSISENISSINGIEGKYAIKIDNNGHVSGFGLISTANNGTPTSTFNVAADAFKLGYADSGGTAQTTIPFAHYNNSRTVDGVTVPAGTYIENAFITAANIKTLDVDVINLDGVTLDTSGGNLIVKSGGIGTSQIGNGAVSSVISVTASDASITTSNNYLNKVTILDEDVTGLGTTGSYLVTVQAYHDGISEEDSFGRIQLYIDNSLAAEAITGARASGGDVVFSMPAALSASGSTSTGSVNFQVKAYSRRYNSDTIAAHNFEYRSIRLSVAGLKK